jgi:hypothetical protein
MQSATAIFGRSGSKRERAKLNYDAMSYELFQAKVQELLEEYEFGEVIEHFQAYALQDGKQRRQLRHIVSIRALLRRLLRAMS